MAKGILVAQYDDLWRMNQRSYRKFLNDVKKGHMVRIENYGTYFDRAVNVTEITEESAGWLLESLDQKEKEKNG